jgi:hypothetical protein
MGFRMPLINQLDTATNLQLMVQLFSSGSAASVCAKLIPLMQLNILCF